MKGTAAVFALGLAVPAGAQEPTDQAKASAGSMQEAPPAVFTPARDGLSGFRLENVGSAPKDLTLVVLPSKRGCALVESDAIVVCAHHDNEAERLRPLPPLPPPPPNLMDKIGKTLTWKIGPVVITPLGIAIAF